MFCDPLWGLDELYGGSVLDPAMLHDAETKTVRMPRVLTRGKVRRGDDKHLINPSTPYRCTSVKAAPFSSLSYCPVLFSLSAQTSGARAHEEMPGHFSRGFFCATI